MENLSPCPEKKKKTLDFFFKAELIQITGLGREHGGCDRFNNDVTSSEAIHILSNGDTSRDRRALQQ